MADGPGTDPGYTNPVVISALAVSGISGGNATISWTTNIGASDMVRYGISPNMDQVTNELNTGAGVTSHSVSLNGLSAGKQYRFKVISRQDSGKDGMNRTGLQNGYSVSQMGEFGAA